MKKIRVTCLVCFLFAGLSGNSFGLNHSPSWSTDSVSYGLPVSYVNLIQHGEYEYCRWGLHIDYLDNVSSYENENFSYNDLTSGGWTTSEQDVPAAGHLFLMQYNESIQGTYYAYRSRETFGDVSAAFVNNSRSFTASQVSSGEQRDYRAMRYFHFGENGLSGISGATDKIVVLIHGWNPNGDGNAYDNGEFGDLYDNYTDKLGGTDWTVVTYRQEKDTDTGSNNFFTQGSGVALHGSRAAEIARLHGYHLAQQLLQENGSPEKIHLVAHSAGAWTARSALEYLLDHCDAEVQVTLLDPYIPGDNNWATDNSNLNQAEMDEIDNFSGNSRIYRLENYYAWDAALGTDGTFLWGNVPNTQDRVDEWHQEWDSHGGPVQFYADTVDDPSGDAGFGGWRLSMEYADIYTPKAMEPSGVINDAASLSFSWNAAHNTTWYQVYIVKDGIFYTSKWVENALSYTPDWSLPGGRYTWLIRGYGTDGYGPWSEGMNFVIPGQIPVEAPEQSGPVGTIFNTRTPTFSWSAVDRAEWYRIYLTRNGQLYMDQWVQNATAFTPDSDLPAGDYSWWIVGWGIDGYGPWSGQTDFMIPSRVPSTIHMIAPEGAQSENDLTYRWDEDSNASYYQLYVGRDGVGAWHNSWYTGDGSGERTVPLNGHPGGTYKWYVRGWSPDGYGDWSGPKSFSTPSDAAVAPVLSSPSGTTSATRPIFWWNASDRASWYRVYVVREGVGMVVDSWTQSTSLTSPINLPRGSYRWWVAAWNEASGETVWSDAEGLAFTVANTGFIYNISLSWGSSPEDLDSHLKVPNGSHVYFSTKGSSTSSPYARLDVDDRSSYGPENIAIYSALSGTYKYYVRNWTARNGGSPYLAGCGARVQVIDAQGNVLFNRTAPASGSGAYWYVFDMNAQTGLITVRNVIQSSEP